MVEAYVHEPVMADEVVDAFSVVPAGTVVDATAGGGGHSRRLLRARPDLSILAIDRDPEAVSAAAATLDEFGPRARVVHGGFEGLEAIVRAELPHRDDGVEGDIVGILFDLGVSSRQLDRPERGFAYRVDAPLDMRMDATQELTAAQVVNTYETDELERLIRRFGEERHARAIARAIVARRPLETTRQLVGAINAAVPARARRRGGHPARRTFQAVRMEVNRELPNLERGLDDAIRLVAPGGRVVTIAYHSLEDRLVKDRFLEAAGEHPTPLPLPVPTPTTPRFRRVARRARRPSEEEIARNPRARSARLRELERLPAAGAGGGA